MGTITAEQIIRDVRVLNNDSVAARYRHQDADYFAWLNDGIRQICNLHPEECTELMVLALVEGVNQTLPDAVIKLRRPIRNMGIGGATPGTVVTFADMETMDLFLPSWHMTSTAQDIKHIFYATKLDSNQFAVYPPAKATSTVQVEADVYPDALDDAADIIPIADRYTNALQAYILFRYFSTDGEDAANAAAAASYYNLFTAETA